MKKILKQSKYIGLGLLALLVVISFSKLVSAGTYYTPAYTIPYIVTASNIPPSVDAGADRQITLPTSTFALTYNEATATDSDGTIANADIVWTEKTRPSGAPASLISYLDPTKHLEPTFSNMTTVGNYEFTLTATDNDGASRSDDMMIAVSPIGSNLSPIADAGPDQTITLPTSSVSISGSGSYDPDGTIFSYKWIGSAGGTIVNSNAMATTITGLTQGTHKFILTVTDNLGATGSDSMIVTVNGSGPSGASLRVSPNTCVIALNGSTCTVTGATWTTPVGTASPRLVDGNTNGVLSTLANNASPLQVYVAYPSTLFKLMDGSTLLDSKTATANCGANSWNGSRCVSSIVNGKCGPTHYTCTAGTYPNDGTGDPTGPWAWSCLGSNGGSPASCTQVAGSGKPECTDGADNDGDLLVDSDDPGCHSDGDASNDSTYVPTDTSERNSKIKEIEI
jgi:hypothetical protein